MASARLESFLNSVNVQARIAKELGIKRGSPEFHVLKSGDLVFDGVPVESKAKAKRKGKDKSKGKGKGQSQ